MATQSRITDLFVSRKSSRLSLKKSSSAKKENDTSLHSDTKKSLRQKQKGLVDKPARRLLVKEQSVPLSPVKLNTNSQHQVMGFLTPGSVASSSPVKLGSPACIGSDIEHVRRHLLSPSKRRSEEDSENASPGCKSPLKSPRKDPRHPAVCPLTPKSAKKTTISSPLALNSTPRRLFESPDKLSSRVSRENSPRKSVSMNLFQSPPVSPTKSAKCNSRVYQSTKKCLHTAKPSRLIGREEEQARLSEFISERVQNKSSGSLYISGAPGTGKTAVITCILDKMKTVHSSVKQGYINCMSLKDSHGVFSNLYEQLTGSPVKGKDAMKSLEKVFVSSSTSVILVLDEIDQLDSKHQHILYRIFEWPAMAKSKLILLGIANALDLTDRVLPRLQASQTCCPELMNFAPYTQSQISDILKGRLEKDQIVEASAINFCARKVSAVAGDIRKALDVCRRAVEMVEADVRKQSVFKSSDCNSPSKKNRDEPVKKVTLVQISKVMSNIYSSSVSASSSTDSDFPLQQKIAVCSLLVLVKSGKKLKEVQLGKLHETYSKVCRRQQIASVDQSEFHSICLLLETRGVVSMKKAKDTRLIKVSLKLDEQELEQTLKDKTLMSQILQNGV